MKYFLDLYEKMYNAEITRKQNIDSGVSLLTGLIGLEIGFLAYMVQNLLQFKVDVLYLIFHASILGAILLFGVSVYYFFRSITGFSYGYISTPEEIDDYRAQYLEFVKQFSTKGAEDSTVSEVEEMLIEQYKTYASMNTVVNDRKVHFQRRVKIFVMLSLATLFVSFVTFRVVRYYEPAETIQKVQIVTGK